MDEYDDVFDEPFFHAPVLVDGLFPSSGFAPLYEDSLINYDSNDRSISSGLISNDWNRNDHIGNMMSNPPIFENTIPIYDSPTTTTSHRSSMYSHMNSSVPFSSPLMNNGNIMLDNSYPIFMNGSDHLKLNDFPLNNQTFLHNKIMNSGSNGSPEFSSQSTLLPPSSSFPTSSPIDDISSGRPSKKRKKNSDGLPDPRELKNIEDVQNILVTIDSNVFDDYISQVTKYRERGLTNEETNIVKDIRRRIKNRESARKCRQNRKNKMESLEEKIKDLNEETHQLQEDIVSYRKENQCLTDEINYLQNVINNNPVFGTIFQEYSNAPPEKRQEILKTSISSQSFFLLAVMFSFGILFNVDSNGNQLPLLNRGIFRDSRVGDVEGTKAPQQHSHYQRHMDSRDTITVFN